MRLCFGSVGRALLCLSASLVGVLKAEEGRKYNACISSSVQTNYSVNLGYLQVATCTAYSSLEMMFKRSFSRAISVFFFLMTLKYN